MERNARQLFEYLDVGNITPLTDNIIKLLDLEPSLVYIRDPYGNTPLLLVTCWDNIKLIRVLLKKGADINAQNWLGYTALHAAVYIGSQVSTKLLLKNQANPNLKTTKRKTPLSFLVKKKLETSHPSAIEIAKLLLEYGADPKLAIHSKNLPIFLFYNRLFLWSSSLLQVDSLLPLVCLKNVRCILHEPSLFGDREIMYFSYLAAYGFDLSKRCILPEKSVSAIKIVNDIGLPEYATLILVNAYIKNQVFHQEDRKILNNIRQNERDCFDRSLEKRLKIELIREKILNPIFSIMYDNPALTPFVKFTSEHQVAVTLLSEISINPHTLQHLLGIFYFCQYCPLSADIGYYLYHDFFSNQEEDLSPILLDYYLRRFYDSMSFEKIHQMLWNIFQNIGSLYNTPKLKTVYSDFFKKPPQGHQLIYYLAEHKIPQLEEEARQTIPYILTYCSLT